MQFIHKNLQFLLNYVNIYIKKTKSTNKQKNEQKH